MRPENVAAYEVLAQVLTHVQRYEQALQACADALAVKPDSDAISASLRQLLPLVSQSKQPQRIIAITQEMPRGACGSGRRPHLFSRDVDALATAIPKLCNPVRASWRSILNSFPLLTTIRSLQNNPAAKQALANVTVPATLSVSEEYDWLVASNVTDALIEILSKFYGMAGVDPQTAPLVQGLERSRRKLEAVRPQMERVSDQSTLVLFELAWKNYRAGQTKKALAAFEKIFSDRKLRQRGAFNPFVKEAVVRAGEMLGRHYDKLGDVEKAIGIYREILSVDPDSLIARRLIVLLSRSGRLYQAVEFAETAIASRPNLFRQSSSQSAHRGAQGGAFPQAGRRITESVSGPAGSARSAAGGRQSTRRIGTTRLSPQGHADFRSPICKTSPANVLTSASAVVRDGPADGDVGFEHGTRFDRRSSRHRARDRKPLLRMRRRRAPAPRTARDAPNAAPIRARVAQRPKMQRHANDRFLAA